MWLRKRWKENQILKVCKLRWLLQLYPADATGVTKGFPSQKHLFPEKIFTFWSLSYTGLCSKVHSPRITLLSGDNPPSSSTKCLLHALSPQQFPLLLQTGKRRNRTKLGQEPTSRQLETALDSALTPTISEKQNFVDQMLRMMIRQKVSKISDLTLCSVTLPLPPSTSLTHWFSLSSFPSPSQAPMSTLLWQPLQRNLWLPRELSLGVFGNAQPSKWPQNLIAGPTKSFENFKSLASEPTATETASEAFLILPPARFLRSWASLGYMPAQSFVSTQILLFLKTPGSTTSQHMDLPAVCFHMGAPPFVLRAILFQQQT